MPPPPLIKLTIFKFNQNLINNKNKTIKNKAQYIIQK